MCGPQCGTGRSSTRLMFRRARKEMWPRSRPKLTYQRLPRRFRILYSRANPIASRKPTCRLRGEDYSVILQSRLRRQPMRRRTRPFFIRFEGCREEPENREKGHHHRRQNGAPAQEYQQPCCAPSRGTTHSLCAAVGRSPDKPRSPQRAPGVPPRRCNPFENRQMLHCT